jgi:hypothetical protein
MNVVNILKQTRETKKIKLLLEVLKYLKSSFGLFLFRINILEYNFKQQSKLYKSI